MRGLETHYKQEQGVYLIEIRLNQMHQLFNSLDPSPFLEKDLDNDVAAYIELSAQEFSPKMPLKLIFYLPELEVASAKKILPGAIHNYFDYRKESVSKELRYILRQGRISLVIGLMFLGGCISLSKLVSLLGDRTLGDILTEGLIILGWVAMWRPLEIFLYDWVPIYQAQKVLEKLSRIKVEVRGTL